MKRGLSLSLCIRDMIEGRVDPDEVAEIRAGTFIDSQESLEGVIAGYQQYFWKHDPERARELVLEFFNEGLIDQPRTRGDEPPYVHGGKQAWWEDFDPPA